MPTNGVHNQNNGQGTNILYVVLHGLISLVQVNNSGFLAHLIEMGDEHQYLYGNWLLEEEVPRRGNGQMPLVAQLSGVDPGTQGLDPNFNLVVHVSPIPADTDPRVRAVIRLPLPRDIHYFISGTVSPGVITGPASSVTKIVGQPDQLSGVRVFEYTFQDQGKVLLAAEDGTTLWSCPPLAVLPDRNVAVLHIYDEPGKTLPANSDHNVREFNESTGFLGVPLQLTKTVQALTGLPGQNAIPGLFPGETATLDMRAVFVLDQLMNHRPQKLSSPKVTGGPGSGGQVCSGGNATSP